MRHYEKVDAGVSAVIVALSTLVLLGLAALALDGGNIYQERRAAQNAADQAALTAAYAECTGSSVGDAELAGEQAAADNGFSDSASVQVDVTQQNQYEYLAEITLQIDTTFGKVLGASDVGTSVDAIVSCTANSGSGTTLHAHAGPTCSTGPELFVDGDDVTIHGGSHSNGDFHAPGDWVTFNDGVTHVGDWNPNTANPEGTVVNPDPPGAQSTSTAPWPYEWSIEDYRPGQAIETAVGSTFYFSYDPAPIGEGGTVTLESVPAGIHFIDGNLRIEGGGDDTFEVVPHDGESGATFVTTGTIQVPADYVDIVAYGTDPTTGELNSSPGAALNNGLQLFSNHDPDDAPCGDDTAILSQGEDIFYNGVVYAPNGTADMTTNGVQAVAIWANFVELDGDGITLEFPNNVTVGDPQMTFVE